jgi:cell division protein FtsN
MVHPRIPGVVVTVMVWALLGGCAARPGQGVSRDAAQTPPAAVKPAGEGPGTGYRVGEEGTTAPGSDVEFKEDDLPKAPEDIVATPVTETPPAQTTLPEEFAPPAPGTPAPATTSPTITGPAMSSTSKVEPSVTTPVPPSVPVPVPPAQERHELGFRVQLYAGEDRVQAERVAREARTRLGVVVYIQFEAPYYKARAGDFADRAAALLLRDRARSYGYPQAWVVTTPIRSATAP